VQDTRHPTVSEATQWVRSTACVQADAKQILDVAARLSDPKDSVESFARKVFAFVRDDRGTGAPFTSLDALSALKCGGSCTNKANLAAALLRAHHIPARTVSHMPTWANSPLYEHWLTEYWQPDKGWVALDPALGRWAPDRRTRIVLSTSSAQDEEKAFDPMHLKFVMPGAAFQSVAELSSNLHAADLTETDAINTANCVGIFNADVAKLDRFMKALHKSSINLRSMDLGSHQMSEVYKRRLDQAKASRWSAILGR
jgi:hypothetical protein